jgi:hypothetical protein
MNTTLDRRPTGATRAPGSRRRSPRRRFFGVVGDGQSYRNIGYLLMGLVLATLWGVVVLSAVAVSLSLLVVALVGIPLLIGTWHLIRAFANVERGLANVLLGQDIRLAPMAATSRGNLWVRLVAMSRERARWRELAYLALRIPVGIATFAVAVVALGVPLALVWAPFHSLRTDDFGDWSGSDELRDVASSWPWLWGLVPLGLGLLVVSIHLLNGFALRCGRWTASWLDLDRDRHEAPTWPPDTAVVTPSVTYTPLDR